MFTVLLSRASDEEGETNPLSCWPGCFGGPNSPLWEQQVSSHGSVLTQHSLLLGTGETGVGTHPMHASLPALSLTQPHITILWQDKG